MSGDRRRLPTPDRDEWGWDTALLGLGLLITFGIILANL